MDPRYRKETRYLVVCTCALCLWPWTVAGQGLSENVTQISGSGSVFTGLTHTRTDQGTSTEETNTEPSFGVSGNIGGRLESGANSLALQYGGTLETERDLAQGQQTDTSSITGASRFTHFDPASRFDFNLGHTVSSVRDNTGFVVDPSNYDTQNTLSAGAGLRFFPGDLSTLRFSGQAGQSFGSGDLNDKQSFTASSELSRRLSERSTGSVIGSRSWSDDNGVDITIDSAQLVYERALENGSFSIGAGVSNAETEFTDGTTTESDAGTGFVDRTWVASDWQTSIQYNRRLSDNATDLSLAAPETFDFLPDSVRLRDLVVSDSVLITHTTFRLCSACSLGLAAEGAVLESQISGATTHEYTASANLGIQLTTLQRLNFGYSWQGDAAEDAGTIVDQIHRFNTSWTRRLSEDTSFSVQLNQSYLRSRLARNDQEQFVLRFVLTRGFSLTGQPK
jgi:hypothetical protein